MKNSAVSFHETQRFTWWLMWIPLLIINLVFVYTIIQQIILKKPFGDDPAPDFALIAAFLFVIAITLFFLVIVRLETEINNEGIFYRLFPFYLKKQKISWDKIAKAYTRTYKPIAEYGGWGFRFGFFGKGRAYNVRGNKGIQVVLKNDKRILLGTQKPGEVNDVLTKLGFGKE